MTTDHLLEYYINQAIVTARQLSFAIRDANGQVLDPTKGNDLLPNPVYELDGMSLLSKTQEICETTIVYVNDSSDFVGGYWKRYVVNGVASSKVTLPQHNYCWARYIICKELMHNYLHDAGSTTNLSTDLRSLIIKLMRGWVNEADGAPMIAEVAAYFGAIEYLMPLDTIPLIRAIFSKVSMELDEYKAYTTIAHLLRIPVALVEYRLTNSKYYEDEYQPEVNID